MIHQMLVNAGYIVTPAYEDSVTFIALSALQRHFVGFFQRGQQQAVATGLKANEGNLSNTQPDNSSATPLCTAAARTGQTPETFCCKDCTSAHLVYIRGHPVAMDTDTCTFQPWMNAQTLRATLSHMHELGQTSVVLLLRVYCCWQNPCITLSEASGTFQSYVCDKYLAQSVHVSIEAESCREPVPLTVFLRQSQEPHQLQSRNIKTVQATHWIAHDHTHRDTSAHPKARAEAGVTGTAEAKGLEISEKKHDPEVLAQADEEHVLSRLFRNSDALPQGTTIELKRYMDRCYKNNETQLTTLSFDGWSNDPVLFKGQLLGRPGEKLALQCSAVVNIAAIKRSKTETLSRVNPRSLSQLWSRETPQKVVSLDRYISHNVKLCRAPAKIHTEQL